MRKLASKSPLIERGEGRGLAQQACRLRADVVRSYKQGDQFLDENSAVGKSDRPASLERGRDQKAEKLSGGFVFVFSYSRAAEYIKRVCDASIFDHRTIVAVVISEGWHEVAVDLVQEFRSPLYGWDIRGWSCQDPVAE
jgi:hypothetical protein